MGRLATWPSRTLVLSLILWRGGWVRPLVLRDHAPGAVPMSCCRTWPRCALREVHRHPERVVLEARVRAGSAACPRCGRVSGRVHGSYVRQLRDAAVGGVQLVIALRVRRFRCRNAACPAVTFAEQVA